MSSETSTPPTLDTHAPSFAASRRFPPASWPGYPRQLNLHGKLQYNAGPVRLLVHEADGELDCRRRVGRLMAHIDPFQYYGPPAEVTRLPEGWMAVCHPNPNARPHNLPFRPGGA